MSKVDRARREAPSDTETRHLRDAVPPAPEDPHASMMDDWLARPGNLVRCARAYTVAAVRYHHPNFRQWSIYRNPTGDNPVHDRSHTDWATLAYVTKSIVAYLARHKLPMPPEVARLVSAVLDDPDTPPHVRHQQDWATRTFRNPKLKVGVGSAPWWFCINAVAEAEANDQTPNFSDIARRAEIGTRDPRRTLARWRKRSEWSRDITRALQALQVGTV